MSLFRRLGRVLKARINIARAGTYDLPYSGEAEPSKGRVGREPPVPEVPQVDEEMARFYANLEVPYGSDRETVKLAWKNLLRKYHPDLHSSDPDKQQVATELVKGLNQAYEQLSRRLPQASPEST